MKKSKKQKQAGGAYAAQSIVGVALDEAVGENDGAVRYHG